jgi:hypothetical protein
MSGAVSTVNTALGGLQLIPCNSEFELRRAWAFRSQTFRSRRGIAFDQKLERDCDAYSHVFLLARNAELVATARCQLYPSPASEIDRLSTTGVRYSADTEVGRLAACRSDDGLVYPLLILALGATYLLERTNLRRYVAHCDPRLIPLYDAVGAVDTGATVDVPDRPRPHTVILGSYEDCAQRGFALLGIDREAAVAAIRWDDAVLGQGETVSGSA